MHWKCEIIDSSGKATDLDLFFLNGETKGGVKDFRVITVMVFEPYCTIIPQGPFSYLPYYLDSICPD